MVTRAGAPVVICGCPHGQVAHTVTVEIAQRGHRDAEEIGIIQDAGEAAFGVADLLVRQDPAGLGLDGGGDQCEHAQRDKVPHTEQRSWVSKRHL